MIVDVLLESLDHFLFILFMQSRAFDEVVSTVYGKFS